MEQSSPTGNSLKAKFQKFYSNFKSLPVNTRRLLSLGMVLAILVALPLTVVTLVSTKTSFFNRAASGEPGGLLCNQQCDNRVAAKSCAPGLTCYTEPCRGTAEQCALMGVSPSVCRNTQCTDKTDCNCATTTPTPSTSNWCAVNGSSCKFQNCSVKPCPSGKVCPTYEPCVTVGGICQNNVCGPAGECQICADMNNTKCAGNLMCQVSLTNTYQAGNQTGICVKPDGSSKCVTPTPSPKPTPTCQPRPACLDGTNVNGKPVRCLLPEPVGGWCPTPNPTIAPAPISPPFGGPVIYTTTLPIAHLRKPYLTNVVGYDTNRNASLAMSVSNLPPGLTLPTCWLGPYGTPETLLTYCQIKGTPTSWGLKPINIQLKGSSDKVIKRTLYLWVNPF